jgi:hypothetical protein
MADQQKGDMQHHSESPGNIIEFRPKRRHTDQASTLIRRDFKMTNHIPENLQAALDRVLNRDVGEILDTNFCLKESDLDALMKRALHEDPPESIRKLYTVSYKIESEDGQPVARLISNFEKDMQFAATVLKWLTLLDDKYRPTKEFHRCAKRAKEDRQTIPVFLGYLLWRIRYQKSHRWAPKKVEGFRRRMEFTSRVLSHLGLAKRAKNGAWEATDYLVELGGVCDYDEYE